MSIDYQATLFAKILNTALRLSCPRGCRTKGVTLWTEEMATAEHDAVLAKEAWERFPTAENLSVLQKRKHERHVIFSEAALQVWRKRVSKLNPAERFSWNMIRQVQTTSSQPLANTTLSLGNDKVAQTLTQKCKALSIALLGCPDRFRRPSPPGEGSLLLSPTARPLLPHVRNPPFNPLLNRPFRFTLSRQRTVRMVTKRQWRLRSRGHSEYSSDLTSTLQSESESPLSMPELTAALSRISSGKAAGPDKVLHEQLLHLPQPALVYLLHMLNRSWLTGHVPHAWKTATVIPLLKPGKPVTAPFSYRPVSLTSCISKILERMVAARLTHIWHPHQNQFAYKKGSTGETELARITDSVELTRNRYYETYVRKPSGALQRHYRPYRTLLIMIDFTKAFDTLNLDTLHHRLSLLPSSRLCQWLCNFTSQRCARVAVGQRKGPTVKLHHGVPQGTVLGPYLFSLYCTPLLEMLNRDFPETQVDMYADDLSLSIPCRSRAEGVNIGNSILMKVREWSRENGMYANASKCEAPLYTLSTHTPEEKESAPLQFQDSVIPASVFDHEKPKKLLGVQLDPRVNNNPFTLTVKGEVMKRATQLTCGYGQRLFKTRKSRGMHYQHCPLNLRSTHHYRSRKVKKSLLPPPKQETFINPLGPGKSLAHMLVCPSLQSLRRSPEIGRPLP